MLDQIQSGETKGVPVKFCFPDDLVSRYATNFAVQHTDHEFILSFFETENPLLLGSPEDNLAALKDMGSVKSMCVSRIIIAPGRIEDLIRVLQANYNKFASRSEEQDK